MAIVGGGYAGLWTALAIRRRAPEARVVVLEATVCGNGPSGRNAGFVNSFWQHLDRLCEIHGPQAALELCELADGSVDAVGEFARGRELDIGYRKAGHLKVSTSPAQDGAWSEAVAACRAHGRAEKIVELDRDEVRARCESPLFRGGVLMTQAATVHPARLARGLRTAALDAGVELAEHSPASRMTATAGDCVVIETDRGASLTAASAVVAINASAAGFAPLRAKQAVSSSHMIVTEPVPDVLEESGWTGGECISTARRYLHYIRTTDDGRIAFGWGAGRLAYGARLGGRIEVDPVIVDRLRTDILSFFPDLRGRRVQAAWGGPIDVSPTHIASIGTVPGASVHYVCGFTGNGVGPAHLAGETLASLALGEDDALSRCALVDPLQPPVPGEPLRYLGGSLVRAALLRQEALEDRGRSVDPLTKVVLEAPRRLGIHVGR